MNDQIDIAVGRINAAVELYNPVGVYGLFSGGHDSLSACYAASKHPLFKSCVHINTGIGIEATRQFVRITCQDQGWPLMEYKASENVNAKGEPDPQDYEAIVLKQGFPGPFAHRMMYVRLKERQLERLERDLGANTKMPILYVSGARSQESIRRMGNTEEVQKHGRRLWVAAIHDWTKLDTTRLIDYAKLKRNPVVDLIHKSGECLCGAFAEQNELEELKLWDETRPAYERIKALEKRVRDAGFPWGWEESPPEWFQEKKAGQSFLLDYDTDEPQHLCWSCDKIAIAK